MRWVTIKTQLSITISSALKRTVCVHCSTTHCDTHRFDDIISYCLGEHFVRSRPPWRCWSFLLKSPLPPSIIILIFPSSRTRRQSGEWNSRNVIIWIHPYKQPSCFLAHHLQLCVCFVMSSAHWPYNSEMDLLSNNPTTTTTGLLHYYYIQYSVVALLHSCIRLGETTQDSQRGIFPWIKSVTSSWWGTHLHGRSREGGA